MFKYIIAIVIALVGATAFGEEDKTPEIRPIQKYSIVDKINLYKQMQKLEQETKNLSEICKDREFYCVFQGFSEDEIKHLKDVYEIYEQVQVETTMEKVLEPKSKSRVAEDYKYLYEVGYKFQMRESANTLDTISHGDLGEYEIVKRQQCFEKPFYLVKTPNEDKIIMQESEITNWKYEPPVDKK